MFGFGFGCGSCCQVVGIGNRSCKFLSKGIIAPRPSFFCAIFWRTLGMLLLPLDVRLGWGLGPFGSLGFGPFGRDARPT